MVFKKLSSFLESLIPSNKVKILYFSSENHAKLINKTIQNGMIKIGKTKKFYLDEAMPIFLHTSANIKPLYILKHDHAINLEFGKTKKDTDMLMESVSPDNLNNLIEMKTMDKLLTPPTPPKDFIMWLGMGVVLGAVVGATLVSSGLIKM